MMGETGRGFLGGLMMGEIGRGFLWVAYDG